MQFCDWFAPFTAIKNRNVILGLTFVGGLVRSWPVVDRAMSNLRSWSTGTASAVSHLENHSFLFFSLENSTKSKVFTPWISHMRLEKDQVFIQSPKSILCPKFSSSLTPYYHKILINLFSSKKISLVYYTVLNHLLSHQKGINIYLYVHMDIWFSPPIFIFQTLRERVYNDKMGHHRHQNQNQGKSRRERARETERGLYPKTLTHQNLRTNGKKGNPCIQ